MPAFLWQGPLMFKWSWLLALSRRQGLCWNPTCMCTYIHVSAIMQGMSLSGWACSRLSLIASSRDVSLLNLGLVSETHLAKHRRLPTVEALIQRRLFKLFYRKKCVSSSPFQLISPVPFWGTLLAAVASELYISEIYEIVPGCKIQGQAHWSPFLKDLFGL